MSDQTEYIKGIYAALSRGDADGFVGGFAADVARVEHFETLKSFCGIDDVKAHVVEGRSSWAEGACTPERFATIGDTVVAYVHVRVRLKDHTDWVKGPVFDTFTFRDGKISAFHSFLDEQKALEYAESV